MLFQLKPSENKKTITIYKRALLKRLFYVGICLFSNTLLLTSCFSSKPTSSAVYTNKQLSLGSLVVNPNTNIITNWSGRYQFNYVSTYDFDLKRSTSEAYTCNCVVIVEVNSSGTGRLVTSLGGDDKKVLEITSCYKNINGIITIKAKNQYGSTVVTHFNTVNNYYTDKRIIAKKLTVQQVDEIISARQKKQ